jgi:hypothetical protein
VVPLVRVILSVTQRRHGSGTRIARMTCDTPRRDAMSKRLSVYVVYPAALFDGWEVVDDRDDDSSLFFDTREGAIVYAKARAAMDGGAVVKLENWFGDTEQVWEVAPPKAYATQAVPSPLERPPPRSAGKTPESATAGSISGRRGGRPGR